MKKTITGLLLVSCCQFVSAADAQQDCADSGGLDFICGMINPEDLVQIPGTDWIIASAYSAEVDAALYLIDADDKSWRVLYTPVTAREDFDRRTYPSCPGAPDLTAFESHGLSIEPGADMQSTLYVVGHGARETVEVFDIDAGGNQPALTWVGCIPMPDGLDANSVASFNDGSIVVTVLAMPGTGFEDFLTGEPTGAVFKWSPGDENFTRMEGMSLPGNNGIEVSRDEEEIYVVSSGLSTVVAFTNTNPARRLRTSRTLAFTPDNVRMRPDGMLLTAGMIDDEPTCGGIPHPDNNNIATLTTCPRGYIVAAVDPSTMRDETIARGPANPDFSDHTIAIEVNDLLWIGTFAGNRLGWRTIPWRESGE